LDVIYEENDYLRKVLGWFSRQEPQLKIMIEEFKRVDGRGLGFEKLGEKVRENSGESVYEKCVESNPEFEVIGDIQVPLPKAPKNSFTPKPNQGGRGSADRANLASVARGFAGGHLQHSRGWLDGGKHMGFKDGEAAGALVRLDDGLKAGRGKIAGETTGRARLLEIRGEEEAGWRKGKLTGGPGLSAEDSRGRENGPAREDGPKGKRVGGGELGLQAER
jgi:hypothetical protein